MLRTALLVSFLAGCSSILGIGDVTLGGDGGPGGDAGPPPNTVIGKSASHCITELGMTENPVDNTAVTIVALIPDATQASGFRTIAGSGKADGTFRIDNVPDGTEYVLHIGRQYFVTKAHLIDQHFDLPGRCDAKALTGTTTLNFSLTGMTPFVLATTAPNGTVDSIEVDSFRVGYQGFAAAPLKNTQTMLSAPYDWGVEGSPFISTSIPLLDATKMDDLIVLHTRNETISGIAGRKHQFNHVVDQFQTLNVTLKDAMPNAITGAFTPAALNKSVNIGVTRGAFDSLYDGTSSGHGVGVTLFAHPYFNDFSFGSTLAGVNFSDWSRSPSLSETVGFMYADPFPASWARFYSIGYSRQRFVLLPGTTVPRPVFAFYQREIPFAGQLLNLTPTLPTPSNVKIAGGDFTAGGKIVFDGMKPVTLTWNGVTGAKVYQVLVSRMFANGNQTRSTTAATLITTNTTIDIPAEVFSGGEFFSFTLSAVQSPADYTSGQLIANGTPNQFSPIPSGMFRLGSKCGNGVTDPGEECDTSGETAMCDIDCTLPKCGDGLRNAAAGEACDTIRPTASCNANCTPSRCGDGIVNVEADEDCDDGNTTDDGNGCSAACKFNGVCGNNKVEQGEGCDSGGVDSGTCTATCTTSFCGDGHLNTVAGEECDDGNQDSGDGCSNVCKKEP